MDGKITALRVQQRRQDRVSVYLDDEYAFGLQLVVAAHLRLGQHLSAEEIAQLLERDAAERAYENALRFLSYRPRSEREMWQYLQRKKVDDETAAEVMQRLSRIGLVNDEEFARQWVASREANRPRGVWGLRAELRQKGVADKVIRAAVSDVDEEEGALRVASRRAVQLAGLDKQTFRHRLLSFLQRRGFSYDIARKVTDHLWQEMQVQHGSDGD
ncbi:MAG: hypothetical protein GX552_13350 [Chloroflexi bacterium]|jgi:regulatory protein|nr:hypothetical protein [Chloroflexota bacterium]